MSSAASKNQLSDDRPSDPDCVLEEIGSYPLHEVPGASGLWAVSSDILQTAYHRHWGRLSRLCDQLCRMPRSADARFVPLRGRVAGLMTALCSFCWQEADGPSWNWKAQKVIARFVPSLHDALVGAHLDDESIDCMSLAELMAGVRVVRNARRGFVPHLMALSSSDLILRMRRSNEARLELRLAEHLYRRADKTLAACARDFLWMARFDLYRALGEERLASPTGRIHSLSGQIDDLHQQLTSRASSVPDRYRWRTLGFSALFNNAACSGSRSDSVIHELLLESAMSSKSPVSREAEVIFEFNSMVAHNESGLARVIERLEHLPGLLLREKSLFTAPAAARLRSALAGRVHGFDLHFERELSLVAPGSCAAHDLRKFELPIISVEPVIDARIPRFRAGPPPAQVTGQSVPISDQPTKTKRKCRIRVDSEKLEIWLDDKIESRGAGNLCHVFTQLIRANGSSLKAEELALPDMKNYATSPSDWVKDALARAPRVLRNFVEGKRGSGGWYLTEAAFIQE